MNNEIVQVNDVAELAESVPVAYQTEARKFALYCREHGFSEETYRAFIESLDGRYSVSTVNKHLSAARHMIRAAFDSPNITDVQKWRLQRAIDSVKYRKVSKGDVAVSADRLLSREEITTLVERSPKRSGLMVRFIYATGCRVAEACAATVDRCTVLNGKTKIRVLGKGRKERTVRIETALFEEIRQTFGGATYLFETQSGRPLHDRNVAKEITRLARKHLARHVTPHMLRHSRATHLIESTRKIQAVSEYLGHASARTTLDMYTHETLSDDDLDV